jgi:sodium transport system permease protein
MIATLAAVFRKELLETLRDRRTLLSSLVMGPLFAPLLFIGALTLSLERSVSSLDEAIPVAVAGSDNAPNLVQFLREQGFTLTLRDGDDAALRASIEDDQEQVIVAIPADYGERLAAGQPARVLVYADGSNSKADRRAGRLRGALHGYSSSIATLRLQARGISPLVSQPVVVDDVDVSTPAARATLVLGMLSYLILLITLLGGLYIAIDATAGERERGSLEPLLTAPVPRTHLIYGKVLAAAFFMTVALALVTVTLAFAIRKLPLESIGMSANFGPDVALGIFLSTLPFVTVGAALLTVVASFTRSYKEAQTWLGAVMLVPTLPIALAGLLGVAASPSLMAVPSLSQHLLIQGFLRGEPLPASYVAISVVTTLALGALLTWLAGRLYLREKILG